MTAAAVPVSRWLPLRGGSGLPLFCLPHAGAGASAYRGWQGTIPGAEVLPVQPPGREARLREPAHGRMEPLVADLADMVTQVAPDGRYAVYGHSLGALVAFELTRELRRRGEPGPVTLFVSGCAAPQCLAPVSGPRVRDMTQPEVVRMLIDLGGTPEWLLADQAGLDIVLPVVRADFDVKETYEYRTGEPLDTPITVLASLSDPRATYQDQGRWRELTSAPCTVHTLTGGHFAVFEQAPLVQRHLADGLAAATREPTA